MKIIELFLDPEALEGGVDAVSIVDKPAHESNFLTFSADDPDVPDTDYIYVGELFDAEEQYKLAKTINQLGEPAGWLESQGWEIFSVEPIHIHEMLKEEFEIVSSPNQPQTAGPNPDIQGEVRVRYKYALAPNATGAPIINTSRDFCKEMLRYNRVFRYEDIQTMTQNEANEQFGNYDIFRWRGSYNCRHFWYKVTYRPVGSITGAQRPITEPSAADWEQPSTQVQFKEEFGVLAVIDGVPLFSDVEDAVKMAEMLGCEGYHEHKVGDLIGYMPCKFHDFASYDDYPQAASDNACRVLKWIDEKGRDEVEGMLLTGLARANQLCKREPISQDTIARMASFARHRQNSKISPEFEGTPWKDKGYVAWLGWGGTEGIEWAERKLEQIKTEMGLEDACWPGYVAYGTKEVDGREVPNCVPEEEMDSISGIVNSGGCCYGIDVQTAPYTDQGTTGKTNFMSYGFSYDDEKMEITGAAIIPNKMIIRRNPITEELYYVFFSTETTKLLAERFMKDGNTDATNLNHTSKQPKNTYIMESWLVKNPQIDKTFALGLEYPEGTWVITMKVGDSDLWDRIKTGQYNGYSIEGYFNERVVFN